MTDPPTQRDPDCPTAPAANPATALDKHWYDDKAPLLIASYLWSLLAGAKVLKLARNPNVEGDISGFDEGSWILLVEEGRRQLSEQSDRYKHTTDRGQLAVTVALAALPFLVAVSTFTQKAVGSDRLISALLLVPGWIGIILGLLTAASVVVVKGTFCTVDATQISSWEAPVLERLAADYAASVKLGEETVADRITVYRASTRLLVWGAVATALAAVVAL